MYSDAPIDWLRTCHWDTTMKHWCMMTTDIGCTTWHSDAPTILGCTTWHSDAPRDIRMHHVTFGAPRDMKTIKTKEVKPMKQIWCHWIDWSSPAGGEEGAELFLTGTRASSFTSDSAAERLRFRAGGFTGAAVMWFVFWVRSAVERVILKGWKNTQKLH